MEFSTYFTSMVDNAWKHEHIIQSALNIDFIPDIMSSSEPFKILPVLNTKTKIFRFHEFLKSSMTVTIIF